MAVLTTMQSTVEKTRELEETTSESSLDAGDEEFVVKVSISPTFYEQLCRRKVFWADFQYLQFVFVDFWQKRKLLKKLLIKCW